MTWWLVGLGTLLAARRVLERVLPPPLWYASARKRRGMRLALAAFARERPASVPVWPGSWVYRADAEKCYVFVQHRSALRPPNYSGYVVRRDRDDPDPLGEWQFRWGGYRAEARGRVVRVARGGRRRHCRPGRLTQAMVPLHPSTRCDLAGRVAETTGFRRGARTLAGGLADGGGYVAFAVGVLLAFPAAIAVCSALGAVLMAADRLTTACPDCGQKRMRHTDSVRTTYPSHRGTGQFYVCEACGGQWFWSNDHRAWRNASTPDFTLDPDEG